jgi:hypothetical protein
VNRWEKVVTTLAVLSIVFYTTSLIIMRVAMGQPSRECFVSYDVGLTFMSMDLLSSLCVAFLAYQYFREVTIEKNKLLDTS